VRGLLVSARPGGRRPCFDLLLRSGRGRGVVDRRPLWRGLGHLRRRPLRGEGGAGPGGGGRWLVLETASMVVGGVEVEEGAHGAVVAPSTLRQI
jgi:hypothetical protein